MMQQTCTFQAIQPGVHNVAVDTFLGCSWVDFSGNIQDGGPGGGLGNIAIHGGWKDHDGCSNSPETINDPIVGADGSNISVLDINTVRSGGLLVGWMYKGSDGNRYYQANAGSQGSINFNIGIGVLGVGYTPAMGTAPVKHWTGSLPAGSRVLKCSTSGAQLV